MLSTSMTMWLSLKSSQSWVKDLNPLRSLFISASMSWAKKTCRSKRTLLTNKNLENKTWIGNSFHPLESGRNFTQMEVHSQANMHTVTFTHHHPPKHRASKSCNIQYQPITSSFCSKARARPKYPWPCKTSLHK